MELARINTARERRAGIMPNYYFNITDREGLTPSESGYAFQNDDEAMKEAVKALAEMAADDMPYRYRTIMSVEIFDEQHEPLAEARLTLEIIPKA